MAQRIALGLDYTWRNTVVSTIVFLAWGNGLVPQVAALGVMLIAFALVVVGGLRLVFSRLNTVGATG